MLVPESEQRGAFVREDGQAHCGVVLLVSQRRLVVGSCVACAEDLQVFLVLLAHPVSDIRLGAELGGQLRDDGECLLGCESLGEVPLLLQGRVGWPPGRAHDARQDQAPSKGQQDDAGR